MRYLLAILMCISALLTLTGCKEAEVLRTEPSGQITDEVVFSTEPVLSDDYDPQKICLQLQPTGTVASGGEYRYYTLEDQDRWCRELEAATAKADYSKHWQQGDRSSGIWIFYQDQQWELLASGELQASEMGRVSKEDGKVVYDMCMDTLQELNIPKSVDPERLVDIQSATLKWNGAYTITDADKLDALQRWLSGSTPMRGGTNCPFEAKLILTLETGEGVTLAMASDSCCVWMSEGVYFRYGTTDSTAFFEMFTGE